jgi:tRNA(Arg) A34 adenosine deaminase TadA
MDDDAYLRMAIDLATESAGRDGGPFGAVVVVGGEVAGRGTNRVTSEGDPTLHAEIVAIRDACSRHDTHDLSGAVLYASCEPCPMCFGAAWWARVSRIVFAANRDEAAAAGFDDAAIFADVAAAPSDRHLPTIHLPVADAGRPFTAWAANRSRLTY